MVDHLREVRALGAGIGLWDMQLAAAGWNKASTWDAVQALRHGGFSAAYHSPTVVVDGAMGLAFVVVGLALLRSPLKRRGPRLFVVVVAVLVVLLGVHAGYVG